ncbi:13663_t:CDS:2, partial [Racocetra fulgida]
MQDPVPHIDSHNFTQGPVFHNDTRVPLLDTNSHEAIQVPCINSYAVQEYAKPETRLVPNYALLSGGARVIPHMTSNEYVSYPEEFVKRQVSKMFNIKSIQSKPAKIVLTSNNEAGNCFCFTGTHGQLAIHLIG